MTMNLNFFFQRYGHHTSAWRLRSAPGGPVLPELVSLARLAERGTLDSLFFADVLHATPAITHSPPPVIEPLTTLGALAAVTEHIGLIGTLSTTYNAPFHIARRIAALDHLSSGRAGWNVVTSRHDAESRNFSADPHADRDDRYARAAESIEVVRALWDSWRDDALRPDPAAGTYADPDGFRPINHSGQYYSVAGPLNLPRPPQGNPVLVQAGGSQQGRDLAARYADALFTVQPSLESAREFYADLKARTARIGRDPATLRILPGVYFLLGRTDAEVSRRQAELDALVNIDRELPFLAHFLNVRIDRADLDRKVSDLDLPATTSTSQAFYDVLLGEARRDDLTVRDLLHRTAAGSGHFTFVGTPSQLADELQRWHTTGAADGFNLKPAVVPQDLEYFVDHVVPILRERGLFRTTYAGTTLRSHYGLSPAAGPR